MKLVHLVSKVYVVLQANLVFLVRLAAPVKLVNQVLKVRINKEIMDVHTI